MYRSELVFYFLGLDEKIVKIWHGVEPLLNMTHYFEGERVPKDTVHTVIVAFSPKEYRAEELRKRYGEKAVLICCTEQADALTEKELLSVDDVWQLPMSEKVWRFRIRRLQEKLDEQRKRYFYQHCLDTSINMLPDLIWYKDIKGSHLKVNDAFCECVAKPKDDVEGRGHYYIWGLTEEMYKKGEFVCLETEEAVLRDRKVCVFDEQVQDQHGSLRELKTWKAPIFDEDGETLIGTVGIARDVTVENQQRRKIEEMAYTDFMTGVGNRLAFYQYMERERNGQAVTMVYIDADHFKAVNDTYGHKVGDEAIICLATGLKKHFSENFITRLGGDEFLVTILGDDVTKKEVKDKLDVFMEDMERTFHKDARFSNLSVSMGISHTTDDDVWGGELIHEGDIALYEAKRRGRRQYVFYDEMTEEMKAMAAHEKD